jgi:hypothetical protein
MSSQAVRNVICSSLTVLAALAITVSTAGSASAVGSASAAGSASASGHRPAVGSPHVTSARFGVPARYPQGVGDTWFNTWASDGNIYATSNDTQAFNRACDSDIAVNELAGGDATQLTEPFVNCMASFGHRSDGLQHPDHCTWKSGGIIAVGGTLYLAVARQGWTGECSNERRGEQPSLNASIVKSTDDGRTWSNGFGITDDAGGAAPQWDTALGRVRAMFPGQAFSAPFFINYGQGDNPASTADGGSQYVYAVSDDGYAYDGSYLLLGRVPRSEIGSLNAADWQFYTGRRGREWSAHIGAAARVLTATHQISQPDIQYYPALHDYILTSFYFPFTSSWPHGGTAHSSTFDFFQAPHPWGPWTRFLSKPTTMTVCYLDCGAENTMPIGLYDVAQVSKFARVDGLSDLVFTSGDFTDQVRYGDSQLYTLHALPLILSSPLYRVTDDFSPAVRYKGHWSSSSPAWLGTGGQADYFDQTLHESRTPGASARFTFSGTSVQWIGSTNSDHGYAKVSVDRGAPVSVDTYSRQWEKQRVLFGRYGLGRGWHTITITVTGRRGAASSGTDQDIDAFVVTGQAR